MPVVSGLADLMLHVATVTALDRVAAEGFDGCPRWRSLLRMARPSALC